MKTAHRVNLDDLFFFKSELTSERKMQIINWLNKLEDDEILMVEQLRTEARIDSDWFNQSN